MDVKSYLGKRGYAGVDDKFRGEIDGWLEWYQGDVEKFHRYTIYNGIQRVPMRRKTLNMAKTVSEDWANLLLNEKTQISAGGFQKQLDAILLANRWHTQAARWVELSFALGTGALVEYLDAQGAPNIDYIRADMIFPLSWENGLITECAFGSKRVIDKRECVYLQMHLKSPNGYIVENHLFDDKSGEEMPLSEMADIITTGSLEPMFQIFMPNVVNNVDLDCPMGVAIFSNALSVLMSLDLVYDSYCNEFDLGRKRVMLPMSMMQMTTTREGDDTIQPVFDTNDTTFYALPTGDTDDGKPYEINMTLRAQEHELALQTQLNLLSQKCGMGNDRYQFGHDGVRTATEVISEKSDLYQNLKKHERLLTDTLSGMVRALAYLCNTAPPDVTIMYDDGIINDDNTKIDNNIKLVTAELKSKLSAIMDIYGMSEKDAQAELDRINEESRSISGSDVDLFGQEPKEDEKDEDKDK